MTTHRHDAIDNAVGVLVAEGLITSDQADLIGTRARSGTAEPPAAGAAADRSPPLLVELACYVGGGFMVAGAGLALGREWDGLPAAVRAGLPAVLTALLAVVAVLAGRPWLPSARTGPARRRLASTLAALFAAGVASTAGQFAGNDAEGLTVAVPAALAALAGYLAVRGSVALFACWLSAIGLLYAVAERLDLGTAWMVAGQAAVGGGWLALAAWRRLPAGEAKAAAVLGGLAGLSAAETGAVSGGGLTWLGAAIGALFLVGGFARYRAGGQPAVLVPVVLTALLVPASVVGATQHDVRAAGSVLALVGVVLLMAGAAGLRHRQPRHDRPRPDPRPAPAGSPQQ